jgi:hypothetical protein
MASFFDFTIHSSLNHNQPLKGHSMNTIRFLKAFTLVGIFASVCTSLIGTMAIIEYGFGFVFAGMVCFGVTMVAAGFCYFAELVRRQQEEVVAIELNIPFPTIDKSWLEESHA